MEYVWDKLGVDAEERCTRYKQLMVLQSTSNGLVFYSNVPDAPIIKSKSDVKTWIGDVYAVELKEKQLDSPMANWIRMQCVSSEQYQRTLTKGDDENENESEDLSDDEDMPILESEDCIGFCEEDNL